MQKVKVSGTVVEDNKIKKYEVNLILPDCPLKFINGNVRYRYLEEALEQEIKEPYTNIRTFSIESIEKINKKASFYNKSIFDLTKKELTDLCCEFCFLGVNTKQNVEKLQNDVALEFLKTIKGIKNLKETAFYVVENKTNKQYFDFELMRSEISKPIFIIKLEQKPKFFGDGEVEKNKISLQELLEKEQKSNSMDYNKNEQENIDKDFKELKI